MTDLRQRSATPADLPYVLNTWVRSYGSRLPQPRRQQAIAEFRRRYVDKVMAADPHIVVLVSPDHPSAVHAYAIELGNALAWVYVAAALRRNGLARQAITAALRGYPETIITHSAWPFPSARFRFEKLAA